MSDDSAASILLRGVPASPGIRVGRAVIYDPKLNPAAPRTIPAGHVKFQIDLLGRAFVKAGEEIEEVQAKLRESLDDAHAAIFDPHLLFVRDEAFRERVADRIRTRLQSAQYAVMAVIGELDAQFASIDDEYISSRSADFRDVGNRICKHLTLIRGKSDGAPVRRSKDVILIAHDLTPSDTAQMDRKKVMAFATEVGGQTSHTAILAKALEIPAVVGVGPIIDQIRDGDQVIVDGYEGTLVINPSDAELRRARNRKRRYLIRERDYRKLAALPAETVDGFKVELTANLEFASEIDHVKQYGAHGVGLFRTEFLYLGKPKPPSEDEQYEVYRKVVEGLAPAPVVFRTLDVGGDKLFPGSSLHHEKNPFLGLRAIRFCLKHPWIFAAQLRAILRASAAGPVRIMFPMVSTVDEILAAKKILAEVKRDLEREGREFADNVEVGVMVEIPSAALTADALAPEVDFFSIGTNDLIQYTLAVDRSNEKVNDLYDPFHPAVLRLIRLVVDAAQREGIDVSVCGEMAANPATALLLVGMGIESLSMGAVDVPKIKYFLRHIRLSEARSIAADVRGMRSSTEIREHVQRLTDRFIKRRLARPLDEKPAAAGTL